VKKPIVDVHRKFRKVLRDEIARIRRQKRPRLGSYAVAAFEQYLERLVDGLY
jgi:hypothetical protein